jgi:DNA-binding transcriptional LysR family regulator
LWGQFLRTNPKVTLDVALSDRAIDLVEEGLDLAIRVASMPHPALIARQLASTRLVLCASPEYLALHGTPTHPRELLEHEVISYVNNSSSAEWRFEGPDGPVTIKTRPRLLANNGDTCRAAALEHQGIILQPDFLLHEDLRRGRLVELMPQWRGPDMQVYAVYTSRRQLSVKLRHMVDFLVEAFRAPPWQAARQDE